MSLFDSWKEMATKHVTKKDVERFWKQYTTTEKRIYEDILQNHTNVFEGVIQELAEKYETSNELIMGFLDGINDSLITPLNLEELTIVLYN